MSYRLEGKDIVISGMAQGIAESPYDGIADMRNINTITIPGEGSVQFKEIPATLPPVLTDIAFTADAATNRFTWAGPNTLYESAAISLEFDNDCEYIVVGGGGGGGGGDTGPNNGGGGGGAGGMVDGSFSPNPGVYPIVIGDGGGGGGGAAGTGASPGSDGNISTITSPAAALIAQGDAGGGGGGVNATPPGEDGRDGASGGGAAYTDGVPGEGTAGQGNDGGTWSNSGAGGGGGGGGGKSGVGGDASGLTGGVGGAGLSSSISGSPVTYAAGGAGGDQGAGSPVAGPANTGNGGGGGFGQAGNFNGTAGGSGVVIIRYPTGLVNATGGTITTSGGFTIHTFTTSGDFEITGSIATDTVYYVRNIVGTTFQITDAPGSSVVIDVQVDFSGTFTTYQYGDQRGLAGSSTTAICPVSYIVDRNSENGQSNGIYLTDLSNYLWGIFPKAQSVGSVTIPANTLIFMGNIGGAGAAANITSGVCIWNGYFMLFGPFGRVDIASVNDIWFDGPAESWDYEWWTSSGARNINTRTPCLVGQDNVLYFCSSDGVGSILVNAGESFDPDDNTTYTRTSDALSLPSFDSSTCLAELGTNLLVGGENSFVYPWDRVSTSFNYPIVVPDNYIANIVGTNQNAYVFAGNRGRIYITNGAAIDLYKKIPDYVTGIINPYFRWRDASFARNQIYFTFTVTTNADVAVQTVNGAWAINLANDALYMSNKITNAGYSGITSMVVEMPAAGITDQPAGTALTLGWNVSGTYGIDVGSSLPYTGGEAFIEFDMIPIATLLDVFTPSQFEFKLSEPLGGNGTPETVRLLARQNLKDSFVEIGITTLSGPVTDVTVALSEVYQTNFEKAQWLQLRLELTSNDTTPTMVRFYEARIRDFVQKA